MLSGTSWQLQVSPRLTARVATDQHSLIIKALENPYKAKVSPESSSADNAPAALRPPGPQRSRAHRGPQGPPGWA